MPVATAASHLPHAHSLKGALPAAMPISGHHAPLHAHEKRIKPIAAHAHGHAHAHAVHTSIPVAHAQLVSEDLPKRSVIVFDYDDTLLASSFLSSRGYRLDCDKSKLLEIDQQLRELEQSVVTILSAALQYGEVIIITNAETGWVELSAQKFIPAILPLLERIKVVSARSTFENRYPDSPLKWKFYAFQEKLSPMFAQTKVHKNVLSFGDSHVEREAVRAVTRGFPNTKCKSVKFAERPTIEQLKRQLELVCNCFQYIHNHDGDLDLQLTVTINNSASNTTTAANAANQLNKMSTHTPQAMHNPIVSATEEKPSSL